ncbi:hypothetical protein F3Y22_tig00112124pilonHSYRG00052 [Hibiscus syriacus]|uniref:Protein kinase domain-containing protein n=1 Tax=Hibiscus syriacus TaxID=106335 RepID=A0A6A2Y9C5_HIBSY|nr:hypothetical protein F3Y22_tig00112124pilonHSYRG00052 [Hibiscus syriacus]
MRMKPHHHVYFSWFLISFLLHGSQAQPSTTGYACRANQTTYPCQTYIFYQATSPNFLDLASIGDLFHSLFIPITCSCNSINSTFDSLSAAKIAYTIKGGDTFYLVSIIDFQNLTTYQSVEVFNPSSVPTRLRIGDEIIFPVFCKCPNETQAQTGVNYLVSYVFQPYDNLSLVASRFGPSHGKTERKGTIVGLAIGLGICGVLLIGFLVVFLRRDVFSLKRDTERVDDTHKLQSNRHLMEIKGTEENLMADVSDCLDRYRVFDMEELREATDCFDESCLIQGSVYKGSINGGIYAIKKMKWNAFEELKILQKKACINQKIQIAIWYTSSSKTALHSRLHQNDSGELNWKTRLRVSIDVANGLQYIHEHTTPKVVHKDIKSSNILLDSNLRAKIANFGLAKSGCNAITMHIVGTQGYIAPEYLSDGAVSTKMDVFAFGVVLLELVSGKEPLMKQGKLLWASVGFWGGDEGRKVKMVKDLMDPRLVQESCSMESVINVVALAIACLSKDPTRRPRMRKCMHCPRIMICIWMFWKMDHQLLRFLQDDPKSIRPSRLETVAPLTSP